MRHSLHALSIVLFIPSAVHAQDLVPEWGGPIGGGGGESGTGIVLDNTGHVYTTGGFNGTMDVDPGPGVTNLTSAGGTDIYVTKFDTSGTLIWARAMGGTGTDGSLALAVDASGNVYTTGGFCGTADFDPGAGISTMTAATTDQYDIFISKLDSNGDFVWAKGIIGGTWWDNAYGIAIDPSSNVVVTGRFYYQGGPRDFDPGPGTFFLTAGHEDIFVLKLDTDGEFIWARDFGTGPDESRGYSIALDAAGNIFTTGYFRGTVDFDPDTSTFNMTSVGTWNVFYNKMDPDGNLVWVKSLPISTTTYHVDGGYGKKISIDQDGNMLTTGRYSGTIDFDPGVGVTQLTSTGLYDIYVSKYTTNGELVWAKSLGGAEHDEGYGIAAHADGSVLAVGTFQQTADFDPGANALDLVSVGDDDMFILNLDGNGDLLSAASMGGTDIDRAYALASSSTGAIYLNGWFAGATDLDPGSGALNAIAGGSSDAFLIKLVVSDGTGIDGPASFIEAGMSIYPNPASERVQIMLEASATGQPGVIEVFDVTGKRVHAEQVTSLSALQQFELSSEWRAGSYLVMVKVEGREPKSARMVIRH
ncbi:MAG: T9SS type A sorting domain-containing protein [Flavobacteriales bacterium]